MGSLVIMLMAVMSYGQEDQVVEMADVMRESGKIYVVVAVLVIIFLGIVSYLVALDRKVKRLEEQMETK